jgi:hypothetical protein
MMVRILQWWYSYHPRYAITGGSSIQVTTNGGASWMPTRTLPPGAGPYQPLQVSHFDNAVWFLVHQQRLLRTREGRRAGYS